MSETQNYEEFSCRYVFINPNMCKYIGNVNIQGTAMSPNVCLYFPSCFFFTGCACSKRRATGSLSFLKHNKTY